MCGLGDKDRRQISPCPFVKLRVYQDGAEIIDISNFNISNLALLVELWTSDETEDITLFPSIASSSSSESSPNHDDSSSLNLSQTHNQQLSQKEQEHSQHHEESYQEPHISKAHLHSPTILPVTISKQEEDIYQVSDHEQHISEQDYYQIERSSGELTNASNETSSSSSAVSLQVPIRNLIGNVIYNPSKLYDDKNQLGIWFILQDLSIRIEGEFKLKFNLISLDSRINNSEDSGNSGSDDNSFNSSCEYSNQKNTFKASVFSNVVKVYSAKRYPGVIDNSKNHLAKIFAYQGIKIPIRRDSKASDASSATGYTA